MKKILFLFFGVLIFSILSVVEVSAHNELSGISITSYNENVDYMQLMKDCAHDGSSYGLMIGNIYEQQRNLKIENMNLENEKTNFFKENQSSEEILSLINDYIFPEPEIEESPVINEEPTPEQNPITIYYTESDIDILAKLAYCEGRGLKSRTELACIMWIVLNRLDNGGYGSSIYSVVTAPSQFHYYSSASTISDYGYDLKELAKDVLNNWNLEKNGLDSNRCLPKDYMWFAGDGQHNYFRNAYKGGNRWDYSLGYIYD